LSMYFVQLRIAPQNPKTPTSFKFFDKIGKIAFIH